VLVVTVSGQNRLTYAALLGKGARAHGVEVFNDMVPGDILGMLERAQKGSKQTGAERMERERDEALASRPRVSESIRALPDRIRENYFAVLAGDERSDIRWPLYWANRLEQAIHEAEEDDHE